MMKSAAKKAAKTAKKGLGRRVAEKIFKPILRKATERVVSVVAKVAGWISWASLLWDFGWAVYRACKKYDPQEAQRLLSSLPQGLALFGSEKRMSSYPLWWQRFAKLPTLVIPQMANRVFLIKTPREMYVTTMSITPSYEEP